MNIWIGTDLAADILGSVKDTPGDKVAQVIVKNANEPYYKGCLLYTSDAADEL